MTGAVRPVLGMEEISRLTGPGNEWIGEVAVVALGSGMVVLLALLAFVWLLLRRRADVKELRGERDAARREVDALQARVWQLEQRLERRTDRTLEQQAWERQAGRLAAGAAPLEGDGGSRRA